MVFPVFQLLLAASATGTDGVGREIDETIAGYAGSWKFAILVAYMAAVIVGGFMLMWGSKEAAMKLFIYATVATVIVWMMVIG